MQHMRARPRARIGTGILILLVTAVPACSDRSSSAPLGLSIEAAATLATSATVGSVVAPVVAVTDDAGRPLAGARVTYEVKAGGGSVAAGTVTSDARGRAVAAWTLGTTAGTNRVTARAPSGQSVDFTVTGVADRPDALVAAAATPPIAPAGGAVAVRPAVRVVDRYGNGVAGVTVTFTAQRGGGVVTGAAQVSDAEGLATVGGWAVGSSPGENVLIATVPALTPVAFTTNAMAVSAEAIRMTKLAGDDTTCPVNTAGCRFTVEVRDAAGAPLPGEVVLWLGADGTSETTTTNQRGMATSPNIGTRTTAGSFTQSAMLVATGEVMVFSYRLVEDGAFTIDIRYVTEVSTGQRAAFDRARSRWQQIITGNLPAFALTGTNQVQANACGTTHPAVNEVVNDVLIFVEIVPIDGPGKVLGSAGPCRLRAASGLPILGVIRLDKDDLDAMAGSGILDDVILHEIGHVLGLGTLWARASLVQGAGTADPFYTGTRAVSGFALGGGTVLNGVPLENTGGTGTRDSHWRETLLGNELMTGFINSGANPLSGITIGSLMDLGYQVNFGAADSYFLPGSGFGAQAQFQGESVELHEVPLPAPLRLW
jgi:hypothetical protein